MEKFDFEEIVVNNTTINVAHYDDFDPLEYTKYLTDDENERLIGFRHINRRREFVATRVLRHKLFGFQHIHYDPHGAPYIEDEGYISISHCRNMVAIAINSEYALGLDLEAPRKNILSLAYKFLSESEKKVFDIANPHEVTKIWSAKEALYKLAGRKKIHFKKELLLDKDEDQWIGQIVNPDHDRYVKLNIFEHRGVIVSINTEEIVEQSRNI